MKIVQSGIGAKVGAVIRGAALFVSMLITMLSACSSSGQSPDGGHAGSGGAGGPIGTTGTGATGAAGRGAGGAQGRSCTTSTDCATGFVCAASVCRVDKPCLSDAD